MLWHMNFQAALQVRLLTMLLIVAGCQAGSCFLPVIWLLAHESCVMAASLCTAAAHASKDCTAGPPRQALQSGHVRAARAALIPVCAATLFADCLSCSCLERLRHTSECIPRQLQCC